jgi:hypothetical protein
MPAPARAFMLRCSIEHRRWVPVEGGDPELELDRSEEDVPCNLQPAWSREYTENQYQEARSFNVYLPAGTEVAAQDRVLVEGMTLEAFGESRQFWAFDARSHHVELVARRVL